MDYSKKIKIGGGKIRIGGSKINHFSDWNDYADELTARHLSKSKQRIGRRLLKKYFANVDPWDQYSVDANPYSSNTDESGYELSKNAEIVSLTMNDSLPQRYIEGSYKLTWTDENGNSHTTRAIPNFSKGEHVANVINEDLCHLSAANAETTSSDGDIFYRAEVRLINYPANKLNSLPEMPKGDRVLTDKYDIRYNTFAAGAIPYIQIASTEEINPVWFNAENPTGNGDPSPRNITLTLNLSNLAIGNRYFYEFWKDSLNTVMGGNNWDSEKIHSHDFEASSSSDTVTVTQATTQDSMTFFRAKLFKKTLGVTFDLAGNPTDPDQITTIASPATPFPKGMVNSTYPNPNMVDLSFDGNYDNVYAMFGAPNEFDASDLPVELKSLTIKNCNALTSFKSESPTYLANVKTLDLSNNGLTAFDVSGLSSATTMNLSNNSLASFIGSGGDPLVDSTFPICNSIESIDLSNNSISNDGLKSIAPGIIGSAANGTIDLSSNSTDVTTLGYYSTFLPLLTDRGWTIIT